MPYSGLGTRFFSEAKCYTIGVILTYEVFEFVSIEGDIAYRNVNTKTILKKGNGLFDPPRPRVSLMSCGIGMSFYFLPKTSRTRGFFSVRGVYRKYLSSLDESEDIFNSSPFIKGGIYTESSNLIVGIEFDTYHISLNLGYTIRL